MPRFLGNFLSTQAFEKFTKSFKKNTLLKYLSEFEKFPKCLGIWENSKILKIYHPQIPKWIWEISEMLGFLGNSPNAWVSWKLPVIWEISKILKIYHPQIPIEIWESDKFSKNLGIWETQKYYCCRVMATIRKISQEKIGFAIFLVDLLDRKKCQTEKPQLKLINFQIVNQEYVISWLFY